MIILGALFLVLTIFVVPFFISLMLATPVFALEEKSDKKPLTRIFLTILLIALMISLPWQLHEWGLMQWNPLWSDNRWWANLRQMDSGT